MNVSTHYKRVDTVLKFQMKHEVVGGGEDMCVAESRTDAVSQASSSDGSEAGFRRLMRPWENHLEDPQWPQSDQCQEAGSLPSCAVKSPAPPVRSPLAPSLSVCVQGAGVCGQQVLLDSVW